MRLLSRIARTALLLSMLLPSLATAAESVQDAEASFSYIVSTLQSVRNSDSLPSDLGIDESDRERFVALLTQAYEGFSRDFNDESAMCRFYRDPENSRMTIEERAEFSFLYLRDLDARLALFETANAEFQSAIEEQFGSEVQERINVAKQTAVSNQWLPSSNFDEAARINFLDAMCG